MFIPTGQSISCHVQASWLELNYKIITKQFAHSSVLRNGGEPLVEEVFESVVVDSNDEGARPQIRAPMAHNLDENDELPLIYSWLRMMRANGTAEEGDGSAALVEHSTEPGSRRVAVDDEAGGEVR